MFLRQALHILLVVTYFVSSIAITDLRTLQLVDAWASSAGRGNGVQTDPNHEQISDCFPRHREAKKVSLDFGLRATIGPCFYLAETELAWVPELVPALSAVELGTSLSRAPPSAKSTAA